MILEIVSVRGDFIDTIVVCTLHNIQCDFWAQEIVLAINLGTSAILRLNISLPVTIVQISRKAATHSDKSARLDSLAVNVRNVITPASTLDGGRNWRRHMYRSVLCAFFTLHTAIMFWISNCCTLQVSRKTQLNENTFQLRRHFTHTVTYWCVTQSVFFLARGLWRRRFYT